MIRLYKNSDLELVDNNLDEVIDKIEVTRKQEYPRPSDKIEATADSATPVLFPVPSDEDINAIVSITLDFVKRKKRKIYGGYAQNNVIKALNANDAFYDNPVIPDIDVYSPTPIEDLIELCNILHDQGYTDVIGKEAQHKETYKIFTRKYNAIDLSYAPTQIYNSIPYVEIDDIRYVHPGFSMIDLYKMMTEPLFSSWRWKKTFPRLYLLQKHYPLKEIHNNLTAYKHTSNMSKAVDVIEQFVLNNENVYLFGDIAYNYFANKVTHKHITPVNVNVYNIISTNYKSDVFDILGKFKTANVNITYEEYYPFWTFVGYGVEISYNGEVILKMYNNLTKCTPIIKIDHTYLKHTGYLQIGSFDFTMLMEMIMVFRQRVLRNKNKHDYHGKIITNLTHAREIYLKQHKLTLLDDSPFKSFCSDCIGVASDPKTEALKNKKKRKENNKMTFMYKPVREVKTKWIFANTSGNKISNPKNLKLKNK